MNQLDAIVNRTVEQQLTIQTKLAALAGIVHALRDVQKYLASAHVSQEEQQVVEQCYQQAVHQYDELYQQLGCQNA